jgi:hypothetical protein
MYLQKQKHVNILLLHHIDIEKATNIKYSILNATLQNKVGMEKSTKKFMSFRGLFLETKEFCPCNIFSLHFLPLQL